MREAMRMVLEHEGFSIREAADGQAALEMVRTDPPDLVFLDLNIPGTSGSEVLRALKGDPETAERAGHHRHRNGGGGPGPGPRAGCGRVLHEAVQSACSAADS